VESKVNGPNGSDANDILTSFAGDLGQTWPPLMNETEQSQFDAFENSVLKVVVKGSMREE
jgi:hypothetical protein